jgi:PKHD-type hydroxylase
MLYNTIFNHTAERARVTYPFVWWDDAFSSEEIDRIRDYCSKQETEAAGTLGGANEKIRKSAIKFHRWSQDVDWIFTRLNNVAQIINNRWYGFALNGYDAFQYTEYRAEEGGKYDWHMDLCMGNESDALPADMIQPRKLSMSLLLSEPGIDYQGGGFQFHIGNEGDAKIAEQKKGRIIAFPSWVIHRVTPVTEGVRRSLVVWVTGPKFT